MTIRIINRHNNNIIYQTSEQIIENASFQDCDWSFSSANGIKFKNVVFNRVNLSRANFPFATFENCSFQMCYSYRTDFYYAKIIRGEFIRCAFKESCFSDSIINNSSFKETDFSGAIFSHAEITNGYISDSIFMDTSIFDCSLNGTKIVGSNGYIDLGWDQRGYHFRAMKWGRTWKITAGCRDFTLEEASKHWGGKKNTDALARLAIVRARIEKEKKRQQAAAGIVKNKK